MTERRIIAAAALAALALAGCQSSTRETTTADSRTGAEAAPATTNGGAYGGSSTDAAGSTTTYGTAPDNTGVNERDRNAANPTAQDQSSNPGDVALTQKIRQSIREDSSLSVDAQNVKIIAQGGVVTLRGPVQNAHEKDVIARMAEQVAGAGKVVNQLEVAG